VEAGLPGGCEEKHAHEKADQQQRRRGDVPSADSAHFLAQNFHVIARASAGKLNMSGNSYRTGGAQPMAWSRRRPADYLW
jgi:hypothetical protein